MLNKRCCLFGQSNGDDSWENSSLEKDTASRPQQNEFYIAKKFYVGSLKDLLGIFLCISHVISFLRCGVAGLATKKYGGNCCAIVSPVWSSESNCWPMIYSLVANCMCFIGGSQNMY